MRERRVIISGGGTGGHLYPALVLGRKLRERDPGLALTFVGGGGAAEREIMAREAVRYVPDADRGPEGPRPASALKAAALLPGAFLSRSSFSSGSGRASSWASAATAPARSSSSPPGRPSRRSSWSRTSGRASPTACSSAG